MHPLTPDDPRAVGPHRLLARLGAGGMGRVYLARTPGGDLAALKLVKDDLAHDPEFRARFDREVRAARRVSGPFTPAVLDADTGAGVPWMATEYVPGPTLKEAVRDHGPLPAQSLPVLASGLARALAAIHGADLVHRDLKPGNVLLSPRGPQVIDFGISRAVEGTVLTRTGQTLGTPAYTSPEQVTGSGVSPAGDVFSLAGTVLFAAGGRPPFGAGDPIAVLHRILTEDPDYTAVPEGPLRDLLSRCLDKDPAERPDTAAILTALADAPAPHSGWLPAPVSEEVHRREHESGAAPAGTARWRRPALITAAAAALLLVGGGGYALTALPAAAPGTGQATGRQSGGAPAGADEDTLHDGAFASQEIDPQLWLADDLSFSADGERLHVTGPGSFSVWDWRAGEVTASLDPPDGADTTPDGRVAAAHGDRIEILDDHGADPVTELHQSDEGIAHHRVPALSPDGARVAALATADDDFDDGNLLQIWDVEAGEATRTVELAGPLHDLEFTADGTRLVGTLTSRTGDRVLGVAVWDADTGEWLHYFESAGRMGFAVHPADPSAIALRDDGDRVRLVDLDTGEALRTMEPVPDDHDPLISLAFSPDGARLYAGVEDTAEEADTFGTVWDAATGETLRAGDALLSSPVAVHPDGEVVVSLNPGIQRLSILDGADLTVLHEAD